MASQQVAEYGIAANARISDPICDDLARHLLDSTQEHATWTRDPRLDLAATELAQAVAHGGALSDEAVGFSLREVGVLEYPVRVASSPAGTAVAFAGEVVPKFADLLVHPGMQFGVGGVGPRVLIVTNPITLRLTQPLPRSLPAFGVAQLDAELDRRLHAPHIALTHEDGTVEHPAVIAAGDYRFHAELACGSHRGIQWIAIEACDESNTQYRIALIPISCVDPTPERLLIEPNANLVALDPARRLTSIINRQRTTNGLSALRGDIRLDRVARAHAIDIAKAREVSHDLGGAPSLRLYYAGLYPPIVVETAAANADLGHIAGQLMNEPGYRSAIERPDLTHVGVGTVRGSDHQLYVVVELAGIPPRVSENDVKAVVAGQLGLGRAQGGRRNALPSIARRAAEARAAGASKTQLAEYLLSSAQTLHCTSLSFVYGRFSSTAEMVADKLTVRAYFTKFGIGSYQESPGGRMPGWIWVAVVYGAKCD